MAKEKDSKRISWQDNGWKLRIINWNTTQNLSTDNWLQQCNVRWQRTDEKI